MNVFWVELEIQDMAVNILTKHFYSFFKKIIHILAS